MEKLDCLNQVAEFHKTFQQPVLETPQIPSDKRCELRVSLISEELKELEQAIKDKDIVEIADALADLQYVLIGTVLEFGLGDKFVELFNEVQRSNMSKACETTEQAEETVAHYLKRDGSIAYYTGTDGKFCVYRNSDDKLLKSVGYSPADLKSIIEK